MNIGNLMPWREKSQAPALKEAYFDPFVTFRREMDRMMKDFVGSFEGGYLTAGNGNGSGPLMDVSETDKEMVVTAEMPGMDEKDFEISLSGDVLTIKGEKKLEHEQKNGDSYYRERRFGSFSRSLRLPFEVKDEEIDAAYRKGVLTVRVPKPAEAQKSVRQIEVKSD